MADYNATALAYATNRNLTPEQVAAWDYKGTGTAAGVVIKPDGVSPPDFFYQVVRQYVYSVRKQEREDARREAIRAAMEAGTKVLAGEGNTTVTMEGDLFRVSSIGEPGTGRVKP